MVTKYAPPPGYKNQPPPSRPSSQQQAWPPTPQHHGQAFPPSSHASYPSQQFAPTAGHHQAPQSQPAHPGHLAQGYSQQISPVIGIYPSSAGVDYPSSFPSPYDYFQQSPPIDSGSTNGRHSSVPDAYNKSYFPPGTVHSRAKSSQGLGIQSGHHDPAPSVAFDYAEAYARQEAGEYLQSYAGAPLEDVLEELESEYDEECYYFAHPEEIDEERSIGWIESHTALPTTRPLPATFNEAELEALAPRAQNSKGDDCISEYFTAERRDEQLNTVRLSDSWAEVKHDLIFKDFLQLDYETIRRDLMAQRYRNRTDPKWERTNSSASVSHIARASIESTGTFDGNNRRTSRPPTRSASRHSRHGSQDVADGGRRNSQGPNYRPSSAASNHSRASSVNSRYSTQRPKALEPIRDQNQDDILAKLGVTGSPRLVYETPGPAFGPPASGHSSRQSSVSSVHENTSAVTPHAPSAPQQHPQPIAFNDPWNANGRYQHRQNPGMGHDLTSSEFTIMEDPDATPRPKNNRSHGLKRHYEGDHHEDNREKRLRDNDATPKQGRKQSRVGDGYGRRW